MPVVRCLRCGNSGSWMVEVKNKDGSTRMVRRSSPFKAVMRDGLIEYIHWACIKDNEI